MQKIIAIITTFIFLTGTAYSEDITKTIHLSKLNPSAISVSIKDIQTGKEVYSHNKKSPMIPASTLKIITSVAALNTLGNDYKFSTVLYKSTNNDLYLKLGADPFLTSGDLNAFISKAKGKNIEPKGIYIDDSIFDSIEWGEGWQWDDLFNSFMPKFSAYNLDKNLLTVEINPTKNNTAPTISVKPFFPITFMNLVTTNTQSKENYVYFETGSVPKNIVKIKGTVNKLTYAYLPIRDIKRYFVLRLEDSIRTNKMEYYSPITTKLLPEQNVYVVLEINHNIDSALKETLKNSNNLAAETMFKLAGAKYSGTPGTNQKAIDMLYDYLNSLNINCEDIRITDGSGVSKNNIITSDFMTNFLTIISKDENFDLIRDSLPSPGEGTLKTRMLYFKDNLKAKTGTLSDVSAITGYITSRRGKVYAFNIMIKDAKTSEYDKKNIEEQILRKVYMNY